MEITLNWEHHGTITHFSTNFDWADSIESPVFIIGNSDANGGQSDKLSLHRIQGGIESVSTTRTGTKQIWLAEWLFK